MNVDDPDKTNPEKGAPATGGQPEAPMKRSTGASKVKAGKQAKGNGKGNGASAKQEEERPKLPDEPQPAPELPRAEKPEPIYDGSNVFIDDPEEEEADVEIGPATPKIRETLPKSRFFQLHLTEVLYAHAIRLEKEDQRMGESNTYILFKNMVSYVRDDLEYNVMKMIVRLGVTLQGKTFLYMYPGGSSDNSWNRSRRTVVADAQRGWIRSKSDREEQEYLPVKPKNPALKDRKPEWPSTSIGEMFLRAIVDRLIDGHDHRILRRLRGDDEDEAAAL